MSSLSALFKKEWMEQVRTGRLMLLGIVFALLGIMNPAVAKLTPWMLDLLSDSLAESGMTVTAVTVNALTSWTQFFKNLPIALIVFVLLFGGVLTREYESGTLILVLTRGLSRYRIILAKLAALLGIWTVGYWLCFGVTYLYNDYFWSNEIAQNLFAAALYWWLFGLFVLCVTLLFSTLLNNYSGVLLSVGATVLISYLIGLLPKAKQLVPTALTNGNALMLGIERSRDYAGALALTVGLCVTCIAISIPVMNRKSL